MTRVVSTALAGGYGWSNSTYCTPANLLILGSNGRCDEIENFVWTFSNGGCKPS